jgi:hypothetical protein
MIDRSLSQVSLPAALLQAGLMIRTLTGDYGEQTARETDDATWLALAGERLGRALQGRPHPPSPGRTASAQRRPVMAGAGPQVKAVWAADGADSTGIFHGARG